MIGPGMKLFRKQRGDAGWAEGTRAIQPSEGLGNDQAADWMVPQRQSNFQHRPAPGHGKNLVGPQVYFEVQCAGFPDRASPVDFGITVSRGYNERFTQSE